MVNFFYIIELTNLLELYDADEKLLEKVKQQTQSNKLEEFKANREGLNYLTRQRENRLLTRVKPERREFAKLAQSYFNFFKEVDIKIRISTIQKDLLDFVRLLEIENVISDKISSLILNSNDCVNIILSGDDDVLDSLNQHMLDIINEAYNCLRELNRDLPSYIKEYRSLGYD
jgi:hypothetical protein